jgi:CsoR family transcriptional regulator, copper-sensing transcriptional repressor
MNCDISITNRIKRAQGQMGGVLTLMDKGASCEDIVTQLKAIRSSIDKAITLLTTTNLIQTIEKENQIKIENIEQALDLLMKHR